MSHSHSPRGTQLPLSHSNIIHGCDVSPSLFSSLSELFSFVPNEVIRYCWIHGGKQKQMITPTSILVSITSHRMLKIDNKLSIKSDILIRNMTKCEVSEGGIFRWSKVNITHSTSPSPSLSIESFGISDSLSCHFFSKIINLFLEQNKRNPFGEGEAACCAPPPSLPHHPSLTFPFPFPYPFPPPPSLLSSDSFFDHVASTFSPRLYFHSHEKYFPTSIENLLDGATLRSRKDDKFCIENPTQRDLYQFWEDFYYVKINKKQYFGMKEQMGEGKTPMYYHVKINEKMCKGEGKGKDSQDEKNPQNSREKSLSDTLQHSSSSSPSSPSLPSPSLSLFPSPSPSAPLAPPPSAVIITYIILYANQGSQTLRIGSTDLCVSSLGEHEGDIEIIQIHLDSKWRVTMVGFEAHGDMCNFYHDEVEWEGEGEQGQTNPTHPAAVVALHGHAHYNIKFNKTFCVLAHYPNVLITDLFTTEEKWKYPQIRRVKREIMENNWEREREREREGEREEEKRRAIKNKDPERDKRSECSPSPSPSPSSLWFRFTGRFGCQQLNGIESFYSVSGHSPYSSIFISFGKSLVQKFFLSDGIKDGNGPNGLGGRSWAEVEGEGEREGQGERSR